MRDKDGHKKSKVEGSADCGPGDHDNLRLLFKLRDRPPDAPEVSHCSLGQLVFFMFKPPFTVLVTLNACLCPFSDARSFRKHAHNNVSVHPWAEIKICMTNPAKTVLVLKPLAVCNDMVSTDLQFETKSGSLVLEILQHF